MRTHRMDLRVYTVDREGRVTREGPSVEVEASDPFSGWGCLSSWPPCQCRRATGRPCPLGGEGADNDASPDGAAPDTRGRADRAGANGD
ncbi:hypothetical protein GCM10012280_39990 [Wenjunlia tyrosinilytica]|uniref:Uncharacterized protein n=1 Tax=Wenjunlia tyrosinilytica TaxID=1544741 RepID=A0A917ZSJ3_9ACTN|nr:hypothetical protein GCM10012280_39990 [Wenjunlia tyrosinilytica]